MPFIGFNQPSHTHDVIAFIHKIVAKGLSETITILDEAFIGQFFFKAQDETVTVSESLTGTIIKTRELTENIQASIEDFVPGDFVLTDFYTYTGLSKIVTKARVPPTETISISELLARIAIKARALTNTITLSDNPGGFGKVVVKALSETISLLGTAARVATKARALAETITVEKGVACYVPLFVYPNWWIGSPYNWTPLINAITNNPTVKFVVAININSGPDTAVNTDYSAHGLIDLRNAATAAGTDLKIIGYNSTLYNNGTRSAAQIDLDTDRWFSFYGTQIDGIFFDEMNNITGSEAFYLARSNYVKNKNWAGITWGNPGTFTVATYVPTVDTIVIVEAANSSRPNAATMNFRTFGGVYPREKFCSIIYNQSSLDTDYIDSTITPYVGYYWVTDDILPNPYDSLPTYLTSFMTKLATIPAATTLNRIKTSVKALVQTVTSSEVLTKILLKARTITQTLTSSEDLTLGGRIEKFLTQTITSSEALAMIRSKFRTITQTITSAEAPTIDQRVKGRTFTETISISDLLSRASPKLKDLAETITSSDVAVAVRNKARALAETISISESAVKSRIRVKTLAETITSSEALARINTKARALAESISISDVLVFPRTVVRTAINTINVSDILTFGREVNQAISQTITILESLARIATKSRPIAEDVDVVDEASKVKSFKPEDTGGAGGVPLNRWEFDLNDTGVYHKTRRNVIGQKKTGGNK